MEKATKWDYVDQDMKEREKRSRSTVVALLESEVERARSRIAELEEEKRVTSKRLERFLRKLEEEKAAWKSRVKEEARLERKHRRELEAANARLLRELSAARVAAKQQAQSYEMERKARELMEEACSELTREVEEDQAEVELLRRECLRMREEMEEERRMLQMAEVWREERVQMKLSDAKLALERKYSQLNHLQAEMESFLSQRRHNSKLLIGDTSSSLPTRSLHHLCHADDGDDDDDDEKVDADSVFEHFRRKEKDKDKEKESTCSSNNYLESPATDLFLAKAGDGDDDSGDDRGDSCSSIDTSDPSVSAPVQAASNGDSSRRSGATKNTALIRRLWRTAITESRNKTQQQPNAGHRTRSSATTAHPLLPAEHCSSSGSAVNHHHHHHQQQQQRRGTQQRYKQSLKEKLMEARMDDHKHEPPSDPNH